MIKLQRIDIQLDGSEMWDKMIKCSATNSYYKVINSLIISI